jgi:hypothetical protein
VGSRFGGEQVELRGWGELLEFAAFRAGARVGLADITFRRELGVLEVAEDDLASFDDAFGDTGEAGDLDPVAFVGAAGHDFVEEHDLVMPFADGDVEILESGEAGGEFGEFVIMGGEEGFGADDVMEVFDDGPGEAEAVEGAGAAADFVEYDEAGRGGVMEDIGGFAHFDHERGLAAGEVVAGADAGEDAVEAIDAGLGGGDEGTRMSEEGEEGDLADIGAFAGHIGSGDEHDLAGGIELGVIGDEALWGQVLVEHGMAAVVDLEVAFVADVGTAVLVESGAFREGGEDIELGEGVGGLLEGRELAEGGFAELEEEVVFEFGAAFIGAQDLGLHILELRGDEAFAVGDGLFADVMGRDFLKVGFGDFDEVAEDGVEADFEGGDSGLLDFLELELGDPILAVGAGLAEFIERGIEAVADQAALFEGERGVIFEGAMDQVAEFGMG